MKLKVLVGLSALLLSALSLNAQEMSDEEIAERIKPYGSVHVAGAVSADATPAGPRSGKEIYEQACTTCHAAGLLGAPTTQVAAEWQPRLDEKGFDTVWQNAINGINAMPPMGTCMNCSNDDIKAAIEYMIEGI
ncbi:c-type cytochrome [Alteromonas sp. ASW11-36]|uniref:C-type cytochrome n=1 Tax=Alteromonas arenosi TaxID=3055817 RepID=A0ABT7SSS4_9ALTE|nr:c-type cytochrome [Alteromonas sp. ASW11-36]MDM7859241.1 c-type cytochrome [Alteromonas sp. ASW11-36]